MHDPWGSSSWATTAAATRSDDPGGDATASARGTTPFPSLPAPAFLTRDSRPTSFLLAPPVEATRSSRPNTPGQAPWESYDAFFDGWASPGAGSPGVADIATAVWAGTVSGRNSLSGRPSISKRGSRASLSVAPVGSMTPDPWTGHASPNPSEGWGELASEGYTLRRLDEDTALGDQKKSVDVPLPKGGGERDADGVGGTGVGDATGDQLPRVHNLVAMYDGLTRKVSTSTLRSKSRASSTNLREPPPPLPEISMSVPEEEFPDDGLEEELAEESDALPELPEAEVGARAGAVQEPWRGRDGVNRLSGPPPSRPSTPSPPHALALSSPIRSKRRRVSIPYPVDLSNLDRLFPDTPEPKPPPVDISSQDPRNSLVRVEERKMWYRISRYGSIRKHKFGASSDKPYSPVTWVGSTVRDDVVKTVRRWLEEGSMNGRVMNGMLRRGGAGGVGVFNWDSDQAPVAIDELFRRSKPSAPPPTPVPARELWAQPAPARFSWGPGGGSTSSIVASRGFGTSEEQGLQGWEEQKQPPRRPAEALPRSIPPSVVTKPPATTDDELDDEEEWGDMVSSPAVGTEGPTMTDSGIGSWTASTPSHASSVRRSEDKPGSLRSRTTSLPFEPAPWGSAVDLSFFDRPPPSAPAPAASVSPVLPPQVPGQEEKSESPMDHHEEKGKREVNPSLVPLEHDQLDGALQEAVRRIMDGLPDLSYMLR